MIFARFSAIYGSRFELQQQTEEQSIRAKREWALTLMQQPLQTQDLERALERCKCELAWPPSIAEFLQRSVPSTQELGVPNAEQAFAEACSLRGHTSDANWSHVLVYECAKRLGFKRLQQENERQLRPEFTRLYQQCCQEWHQGAEFKLPTRHPRLDNNSCLSGYLLIQQLIDQQQLDSGLGHQLYYYLTQDLGSQRRLTLRQAAIDKAERLQLSLSFPN